MVEESSQTKAALTLTHPGTFYFPQLKVIVLLIMNPEAAILLKEEHLPFLQWQLAVTEAFAHSHGLI